MMKFVVSNIDWAWDEDDQGKPIVIDDIPEEVEVDIPVSRCTIHDEVREYIENWLSDRYGYCVNGFSWDKADDAEPVKAKQVFTMCIRRSDVIWWNVLAEDLEDAKRIVYARASTNDWWAGWDWSGDEVGVVDSECHLAPNEDWDFTDPEYPEAKERHKKYREGGNGCKG